VDAAIVHDVAGQGLAGASCEGVALVSLQAVAVLDALRRIPLADGVRTAEDDAAFPSRHTAIVDVPLEVPLAATNPIIAEGILTTVLGELALGGQLAAEAIAFVARLALALGFAQFLVSNAVGMDVAHLRSLKGFHIWFQEGLPHTGYSCNYQFHRSRR